MKTKILFAAAMIATEALALPMGAGTRGGNGGVAVVCRDSTGVIEKATLLDVYQAALEKPFGLGIKITVRPNDWKAQALQRVGDVSEEFKQDFLFEMKRVLKPYDRNGQGKIDIPYGTQLPLIGDFTGMLVPRGCKHEQLANYRDDGVLLVDREIYGSLNTLNQHAFLFHEAIYKLMRDKADASDSDLTRKLVALLLADEYDRASIQEIIKGLDEFDSNVPPETIFNRFWISPEFRADSAEVRITQLNQPGVERYVYCDITWARIHRGSGFKEVYLNTHSVRDFTRGLTPGSPNSIQLELRPNRSLKNSAVGLQCMSTDGIDSPGSVAIKVELLVNGQVLKTVTQPYGPYGFGTLAFFDIR